MDGFMLLDTSIFGIHVTGDLGKEKRRGHGLAAFQVDSETQSCFGLGEGAGGEYGLELVPSPCVVGTSTIKS
jgi:hypothetical protein